MTPTQEPSMSKALSPDIRPAAHRRSSRRQHAVLLVTASLLAVWLGVAAPSVSPVDPAGVTPVAAAAAAPAAPPDAFGPARGGR
jgi:hypothetical protein